jgi:uncharacterized protein (TIGR03067 family)
MKHLFLIAVLMLAAYGRALGDPARDERELTQLIKDLNVAVVKADLAFLERVLHKDYVHHRPHGTAENRAEYLENRRTGRVDFESLASDEIRVRLFGDTAVVTGRSTAKGKDQHGAIDDQRLWTRVFLRRDGRWQLVHYQGTPVPIAFGRPAEGARKSLQGTWTATKAERDGRAADDVIGHRLSVTNNRFQIKCEDGKLLYAGTVRVDPSTKPAAIDFELTKGALAGTVWKGIYALNGDTLTTCDNAPDPAKGRPAAFEAASGSGYVLITLRRAKP